MAFGLLGSVIPQVNQNTTLYVGIQSHITKGKVSICNKNYNPARVRLGYEDAGDIKYFEYNRLVNYGESLEVDTLYVSELTDLIVRSDQPGVNFVLYGETLTDTQNPVKSGIFNQLISSDTNNKLLYTAPVDSKATVTLTIVNLDSEPGDARIGISNSGLSDFDTTEYIEYNVRINANQTYTRSNLKLDEGQSIICASSNSSNLSFIAHGELSYIISVDDLSIVGNLGIGTTASPNARLDVLGQVRIREGGISVNEKVAITPTGGFSLGITSTKTGLGSTIFNTTGGLPIRTLDFVGLGNTFAYQAEEELLRIDTGSISGVSADDKLGCAFIHYGGFNQDNTIKSPQKFHEIFSHEDAAVDVEEGVTVTVNEDCLLVITDKDTFDSFTSPTVQTNLLSSDGFADNIRSAFDNDVSFAAQRKVGYVMIPSGFQDTIGCDIEEGVTVSIGDMSVLNIGGGAGLISSGSAESGSAEAAGVPAHTHSHTHDEYVTKTSRNTTDEEAWFLGQG